MIKILIFGVLIVVFIAFLLVLLNSYMLHKSIAYFIKHSDEICIKDIDIEYDVIDDTYDIVWR